MMEKRPVFSIPCPSTATIQGPTLSNDERGLLLTMTFDDDGTERLATLLFIKPRAFRKRAEIYCKSWHIKGSYDTVCEVHDSDWVQELRNDSVAEWRDHWVMRHFMIYLDSFGCFEVVAESASLEDSTDKNSGGT